jgi:regulator of telomere elongation helicase 1
MCIHKEIQKNKGMNLNIACNKAVRGGFNGIICKFKDGVDKFAEAEAKQETWKIQDIEDLHEFGESAGVCPYFLQKERVKRADLILMPYNYLIDEKIRENFEIDYRNAVLIIDEAHNIGGV